MKEILRKKIVFTLIFMLGLILCFTFTTPVKEVHAKTFKKNGVYAVEGFNIKSINFTKNKITVTTYNKNQMSYRDDEHLTQKMPKKITFKRAKKLNMMACYYLSGNFKDITPKKLKKLIKISKSYSRDYKLRDKLDETPLLMIIVEKGKAAGICYYEGCYDILAY